MLFKSVAGIFPFVKFAQTPPSLNANEILTPLIYVNMNILTNVPAQYGTLLCYGNSTHTVQLYAAATNTNAIYFRQRTSQAWTQWLNLA